MRIKSFTLSVGYKLILAAICFWSLTMQLGTFEGRFNLAMFRFFTNQSNFLVGLYFVADIVWSLRRKEGDNPLWPALKSAVMMGVTVTWLVAHFLLGEFTMGGTMGLSITGLHYIVPIMTILDWLLFDRKGLMRASSPLVWTAFPLAYFAYALIASQIGDGIGYGGSRYPYPFIDVDLLGYPRVLMNAAGLTIFFVALGYIFYAADRLLSKKGS